MLSYFIREIGSYKKMDVWIDFIAEVDFVQSAIQIAETYKYTKPILIKKDYSYFDVKDIPFQLQKLFSLILSL